MREVVARKGALTPTCAISRLAVAGLALVGLAACGGGSKPPAVGPPPQVLAQEDLRKVVYTAAITVRVDDAARSVPRATEIATAAGGFVFALTTDLEGRPEARLTIKVPPERFEAAMDQLAALGTSLDRDIKARDVTEEVVDVDGRIRTAQASVDRLRTLLAQAATAADLVVVETELAKREAELESLQGRLRVLSSQVDLATINLRLTERSEPELARDVPGFAVAVRAGWVALRNVAAALVAATGFVLPFAPLVVGAAWFLRRRRPSVPSEPY
ncbi:MAG: DUF4349 domain-containing protein [Acidimicrobiales bacterium]